MYLINVSTANYATKIKVVDLLHLTNFLYQMPNPIGFTITLKNAYQMLS